MTRQRRQQPLRETVAIIGDGQTERIYFANVRDTDRPAGLTILPDYPKRIGNYKGVFDRAMKLTEDYSRVYALIDMDKVIQDKQQDAYRKAKIDAEKHGVIVLENNPCFEVWILIHFTGTGKLFKDCNDVVKELKKYIPGYDKSERFQVSAELYSSYKKQLVDKAIPNAQLLEKKRSEQDQLYPRAEIFRFFEWYFESTVQSSSQ